MKSLPPERLKQLNAGHRVNIYVKQRKGDWTYVIRWYDKRNHFRSLDTQDLSEAQILRDLKEAKLLPQLRRPPSLDEFKLSEIGADFIQRLTNIRTDKTIQTYKEALNRVIKRIGNLYLSDLNTNLLQLYVNNELSRGRKLGGVMIDIRYLKAVFNYAKRKKLIRENPCDDIELPRQPRRIQRRIEEDEFRELLTAISSPRDKTVLQLLFLTGMRISELLNLRWSDIHGNRIFVTGKGGHEREIPIGSHCRSLFNDLPRSEFTDIVLHSKRKGKMSYSRLRNHFKDYFLKSSIRVDGTFHVIRHTTASALADMGFNEFDVRVFLGHSDKTVTQGYMSLGRQRFYSLADALETWLVRNLVLDKDSADGNNIDITTG